ncbi:MAG: NAD-dependent epimerase/dehydratase family protein [Candidatus Aminicenantes bacterium]|nr:NAD-dependent epimerase/dehydratase family protein [Candidatus Aminicenantes bacterium]
MKIFITGGTGFIGSHLVDFLSELKNTQVYALTRNPINLKWLKGCNITLVEGDLFCLSSLPSGLDYVFHIAGVSKSIKTERYYTVNHEGTASLFQKLASLNPNLRKVIYLSSLAAAGPCRDGKIVTEKTQPFCVTPYGKSKRLGEKEALKYKKKFPVIIARVGPVFGPRDKDFLPYFKLINKGIFPSLDSKAGLMSMCYVKDLIRALYLCMTKDLKSGEIFHIADPHPYSWDDLGKTIAAALGKKPLKIDPPYLLIRTVTALSELSAKISKNPSILNHDKLTEMNQEAWITDTSKAKKELGFETQYSLEKAVKETVHWYKEQHWL